MCLRGRLYYNWHGVRRGVKRSWLYKYNGYVLYRHKRLYIQQACICICISAFGWRRIVGLERSLHKGVPKEPIGSISNILPLDIYSTIRYLTVVRIVKSKLAK